MNSSATPSKDGKPWPRIRDLPVQEQEPFREWLKGKSAPYLGSMEEQDGYWPHDYRHWKNSNPPAFL